MLITSSFEGQNIPTFDIEVIGVQAINLTVGIDTGFTGFLSIPWVDAFRPGIVLGGVSDIMFADGKTQPQLWCWGMIKIDSKQESGVILISSSKQALIGMEFLRIFGLKLTVDSLQHVATLTDEII